MATVERERIDPKQESTRRKRDRIKYRIKVFILDLFLIAIIIPIGILWVEERDQDLTTENWIAEDAIVTETKIIKTKQGSNTKYTPIIYYSYNVSGEEYRAARYYYEAFHEEYDRLASVEEFLEGYHMNASITIYYNPENPAQACIVPGVSSDTFLLGLWLILLTGLLVVPKKYTVMWLSAPL